MSPTVSSETSRVRTAVFALLTIVSSVGAQNKPAGTLVPVTQQREPNSTAGNQEIAQAMMLVSPCTGEVENFCMNGACSYNHELNTPSCRCLPNFTGERCQHFLLGSQGNKNPENLIAIGVGGVALVCCLVGAVICCTKRRCNNKKQPYEVCQSEPAV
ncbi:epigen [Arapaima gigas]